MTDHPQYHGHPSDPATQVCEFCDRTASEVTTLVSYKHWIYTCEGHVYRAEAAVGKASRRRPPRLKQTDRLFDPGEAA